MDSHTAHTRIPLPSRQASRKDTTPSLKTHWGVLTLTIALCLAASLTLLLLPSHSATLFAGYGVLISGGIAPLLLIRLICSFRVDKLAIACILTAMAVVCFSCMGLFLSHVFLGADAQNLPTFRNDVYLGAPYNGMLIVANCTIVAALTLLTLARSRALVKTAFAQTDMMIIGCVVFTLILAAACIVLPVYLSSGGLDWDNPAPLLTGIVAPAYLFLLTHRLNSGIVRWASAALSALTALSTLAFIFYGDLALKPLALEPDLITPDSIAWDDYPLVILLTSLMSIVILFIITLNARPQRVSSFRHSAVLPVSALLAVSGLLVAGRALLTGELVWTASLVSLALCGCLLPAVLAYAAARYASGSTRMVVLLLSVCQFFLSLFIVSSSDTLTGTPPDNGFANYHTGQILNVQMAVVMILLSMVSLYMLSTHERRHSHE